MSSKHMLKIICVGWLILLAFPIFTAEAGNAMLDPEEMIYRSNLGRADDVKLLLSQGNSANLIDETGIPILALAAARLDEEALPVVKTLLEAGADVDAKDHAGQTALFYAARHGNKEVVQCLLEHRASYYLTDNQGNIARTIAFRAGHLHIVDLMDHFVKEQTDKVTKQYDEYNKALQEQYKKGQAESVEPLSPPPTLEPPPAPLVPVIPEEIPKPDPKAAQKTVENLAFESCAFQYWSFYHDTMQAAELSDKKLNEEIDTHKKKIFTASTEMTERYNADLHYVEYISDQAKQHIFNQLSGGTSRSYHHRQSIGRIRDMETRCHNVAQHWQDPIPVATSSPIYNESDNKRLRRSYKSRYHSRRSHPSE